jgi:hypothetical protein
MTPFFQIVKIGIFFYTISIISFFTKYVMLMTYKTKFSVVYLLGEEFKFVMI